MERRTVQLRLAGQTYRVVTTASDAELKRFVSMIDEKLSAMPHGKSLHPQALLLATLALAHDLEEERARSQRIEARAKETLVRLVERIDAALDEGGVDDAEVLAPPSP
jgi:cell division protein ZapA